MTADDPDGIAPTAEQLTLLDLIEKEAADALTDGDRLRLGALADGDPEFADFHRTVLPRLWLSQSEGGPFPEAVCPPPAALLDSARRIDQVNPTPPDPAPSPPVPVAPASWSRRWLRVPVVATAATAATVLLACAGYWAYRWLAVAPVNNVAQAGPSWLPLTEAKAQAELEAGRNVPLDPTFGHVVYTAVDPRIAASTSADGFTPSQLAIEKFVRDLKVGRPVLTLGGTEVAVPEGRAMLKEDVSKTAFRVSADGKGYEVYTATRRYFAETVSEVLFTVQDPNIFPGSLLNGSDFAKTQTDGQEGKIVPLPKFNDRADGGRAPVKLSVLGVSLVSKPPTAAPAVRNIAAENGLVPLNKRADVEGDPYTLTIPTQQEYQKKLQELIPRTKLVSNVTSVTEITTSSRDLLFQLGASASFSYGGFKASASGSVTEEENTEKAMVFQFLRQAAYTVAVDSPPPAPAGWFAPDASVDRVRAAMTDRDGQPARPIYVDSVTYGRTALLLCRSSRASSAVKKAMAAAFEAKFFGAEAKGAVSVSNEVREVLAESSFQVLLYGGPQAKLGLMAKQDLSFADAFGMMAAWYATEFKPEDALPIAFSVKYLADHRPAGFVGVHPHRTYTGTVEYPKYDVVWNTYHSGNDSDHVLGIGFLGEGSRVILMSATDGTKDFKRWFQKIGKTGDHTLNASLDGQPGVGSGATFTVKLKFGAKNGGASGDNWAEMENCKWKWSTDVSVNLAALPASKVLGPIPYDLPDGNRMTVSIHIRPPAAEDLPKPPDLLQFGQQRQPDKKD